MMQGSPLSQRSTCVCPMHICSFTYSNEACTLHQQFVQLTALQMSGCYCSSVCTWWAVELHQFSVLRKCDLAQCSCPATKSQVEIPFHCARRVARDTLWCRNFNLHIEQCSLQWRTHSILKRISSWVLEPHTCSADCKALLVELIITQKLPPISETVLLTIQECCAKPFCWWS